MKRAWTTLRLIVAAVAVATNATLPARGDYLTFDIASHEAMADSIRFESRSWAEGAEGEGGRLAANTTWLGGEHVILNDLYIPSGVTLTINAGTVVKFREGTRIKVEDGGSLVINGASGNEVVLEGYDDATVFKGIVLQSSAASYSDNTFVIVRGFNFGRYATVSLNNTTAFLGGGQALVPVDVSGSRDTAFSFDWVAETNGVTFASGTMNWNRVSDGRKNITVPYPDGLPGCSNFVIRAVTFRCCSPNVRECVVTLSEFITTDIFSHEAMADYIAFESREWAAGMEGEGGRLATNATWSGKHTIVSDVYIPSGVTLTLTADTVVEFCEGTRIKIEDGGTLNIVGADGHDVILRGAEGVANFGGIVKMPSGTFTDNGYFRFEGFTYGTLANVALHDSSTFRSSGLALIPVTVSGSRSTAFSIDWVAETNGVPYKTGTLKWNNVSEGTKNISINYGAELDGYTNFTLRAAVDRACKTSPNTCTIKISDFIVSDIASHESMADSIRFESRDWVADVLSEVGESSSIAVESGRLQSNETWSSDKTHLILSDLYIPSGVTLTLAAGAVVEFCEGTCIKIEDGGVLNVIGADGHDVIFRGFKGTTFFDGIRLQSGSATYRDNMYVQFLDKPYSAYPYITVHEATTYREAGKMWIAFSLSGSSRNQSFNVDWSTDKGDSGTLTWSSSSDGTKWIEIPVDSELVGGTTNHVINLTAARGCNISVGKSVLTVIEPNYNVKGQVALAESDTQSNEFAVNGGIKTQPLFLNDVETVQYSGKWQPYDENEAAVLRVTLETDNGATVLKEVAPSETGAFDLDLKQYPVGYYTLKHEVINDLGETLATMQKTFSIADEEDVELHGGTLKQNEVWSADKVHVVYETVVVPSIYTIFIEPGAIVKFMTGTGIDISQGGAFFANRIVFTHINDDTVGGDTLSDGFTVAPPMDAYYLAGAFTFGDDTELRGITQNNALTGTIATQKTLSRGSTYRVSGTLTIASGGSLTIPAGTVLKMEAGASIVVNSGATLNAIGTRASPIVITSIKDDSYSGDTNGDGGTTIPQPGDWEEIKNNGGTMNLAFVEALYGGYGQYSNQGDAIIRTASGTTKMDCCVVRHSNLRLVGRTGGTVTMENCVLEDGRWGVDGAATLVNCVIANCNTGANGATLDNSVLWECDTFISGGAALNCVFWNVDSDRPQSIAFDDTTGNIWGDPLFVDPVNGDFRVKEGSPCVDAADSAAAPEYDYYGQPRITIVEHGEELVGQLADIGICEVMPRDVVSDIDLVPQSVRTTTNAVPGQLLFVKWEIANVGGREVEAAWRDTVSLVSENGREVVLGDKTTSNRIGVGGSVFCSGYFTVPAIAEGTWYPKVNVNSYHDIFEGSLAANNALTGERAVSVGLEALDPSIAREGIINSGTPTVMKLAFGDNDDRMVKFDVPAGVNVTWGFGFMPGGTRSVATASGSMTASGDGVMFRVPDGATDVYVVLESDTTTTYNLSTESTQMTITGVTPATLPSSGTTTLTITGAGFGEDCEVTLANGGDSYRVQSKAVDGGQLSVAVDCAALKAGKNYDLVVTSGESDATLPGAVTVTKAEGKGILELEYDVPSSVRPGRVFTFTVTYRNTGNKDMCVPLLTVQDTGNDAVNPIQFSLDGERFTSGGFQFVGMDTNGGFGPLQPGDEVTLMLAAKIPTANNGSTAVSVRANSESDIIAKYTTEIDRYLTPAMKAEFAATMDAELKARGERMAHVFGANNGEMVQNFAALAKRFYECNGFVVQKVEDLVPYGVAVAKSMEQASLQTNAINSDAGKGERFLSATSVSPQTGAYLYPERVLLDGQQLDLSGYDIVVIAHGWTDGYNKGTGWMAEMAAALHNKNFKVIYLDWSEEAAGTLRLFNGASTHIPSVAAKIFGQLKAAHVTPHKCTFIGHSLGSHLNGYIARLFVENGLGMVYRHIGLDTATDISTADNIELMRNTHLGNGQRAASRFEYYRSSCVAGDNTPYADYNFIVAPNNGFWRIDPSKTVGDHRYSYRWLIRNINSGDSSAIGFWFDPGQAKYPISNGRFIGVVNGDVNKLECIYPYEEGHENSDVRYPGNQLGWVATYDNWVTIRDQRIDVTGISDDEEILSGDETHVSINARNVIDVNTVEQSDIDSYCFKILVKRPTDTYWQQLVEQELPTSNFDTDIVIPHELATDDWSDLEMKMSVYSGHDHLFGSWDQDPDLYWRDNEKNFRVKVRKGDKPIPDVNGCSNNGFILKNKPIEYESQEAFDEAKAEKRVAKYVFDASKSKVPHNRKIEQYMWVENGTVVSREVTFEKTISATTATSYPIKLVVMDDLGVGALIEGQLDVTYTIEPPGDPVEQPRSYDPNEMSGPLGLGDPETERFVKPGEWMTYTVYFENQTNATAAAQEVYVTNPLNEWLDWSTFEMGEVAFGNQIDLGLSGKNGGSCEATMKGTNYIVRTALGGGNDGSGSIAKAGVAHWYLRIVDPTTETGWPSDILAGFLPPNDETFRGEGHLTYRIRVRDDAPANVVITNSATIVFDYNDPIETDPAWWNTVAKMQAVVVDREDVAEGDATNLDLVVGVPYGELPAPKVRAGYTFGGWFTGPNGTGRRVTAQSLVEAGDNGLYALWLTHAYTVRFNANGGEGVMSDQAFAFDKADVLDANVFSRRGYSFLGWATNETGAVVYEDEAEVLNLTSEDGGVVDLFAVWQLVSMKVTFDPNGGSLGTASAMAVVTNGFAYGTLPTAVREGYSFVAWTSGRRADSPVVTAASIVTNAADHALYAQWRANSYTVVYDANGGEGEMEPLGGTYDLVSGLASNAFSRISHRFLGWATSADGPVVYADGAEVSNLTAVAGGTVTLYAVWELLTVEMAFDAQGGSPAPTNRVYLAEIPYGELPEVSREGYTFGGWYTGPNGTGRRVTAQGVAEFGSDGTLYANWLTNAYTVRFNANGGEGVMSDQAFVFDKPDALDSNAFVRANHDFIGWAMAADGESVYADGEVVENLASAEGAVIDLFAVWVRRIHTVDFYADETMARLVESRMVGEGLPVGALPASPKPVEGYSFAGWRDMANPGTAVTTGTIVVEDMKVCAVYTANTYTLFFEAAGGSVSTASKSVVFDEEIGRLPHSTRDGYTFEGWYVGNVKLTPTMVYEIAGDAIATAHWTEDSEPDPTPEPDEVYELYEDVDGAVPASAASVYDGYLYSETTGAIAGTIQVKVGKANAKTRLAAVKATVVGLDGKKKSLKAAEKGKAAISEDDPTTIKLVGGELCEVTLGAEGLSGFYGNYEIDGARNFFTSKDKGEQNAANGLLASWLGPVNVAWDDGNASVAIGKKGKVKVYVTLANGTKAMVNTQLLIGEEWLCVPVVVTKKMNLAFTLWLPVGGGAAVVEGLSGDAVVGKSGALKAGAKFRIDAEAFSARWGQRALPYLPDGVSVTQSGARWTLPKAGKVQMAKDGTIDSSKLGENPSALKLTYKAKDGSFKGSFKAYSLVNGKPKAVTVNVAGVVVGGVGYGTATIKKVVSVPISIE